MTGTVGQEWKAGGRGLRSTGDVSARRMRSTCNHNHERDQYHGHDHDHDHDNNIGTSLGYSKHQQSGQHSTQQHSPQPPFFSIGTRQPAFGHSRVMAILTFAASTSLCRCHSSRAALHVSPLCAGR